MLYNEKEYYPEFSVDLKTINKNVQSRQMVLKIFEMLNSKKYSSFEDFAQKNRTLEQFIRNNSLNSLSVNRNIVGSISLRHFMGSLTEEDYKMIMDSIMKLTKAKRDYDKDKIKVTRTNETNAVSYNGAKYSANVLTDGDINKKLEEMQKDDSKYQTTNGATNAENMFKKLNSDVMESLNFKHLYEVATSDLTEEEQQYFDAAIEYQEQTSDSIMVDLTKGYIIDSNKNIYKISNVNGKYRVISGDDEKEKTETSSYQKTLKNTSLPNNY